MCILELVDHGFGVRGDTRWKASRESREHRRKQRMTQEIRGRGKLPAVQKCLTAEKERLGCGKFSFFLRLDLDHDFVISYHCPAHKKPLSEKEDEPGVGAKDEMVESLNAARPSGTRVNTREPPALSLLEAAAIIKGRVLPRPWLQPSALVATLPMLHTLVKDEPYAGDPQHCEEYVPDIFRNLQRDEALCLPQPSFCDQQPHINSKMRAILIDWLVDVHKQYRLRAHTLFLATSVTDRFLNSVMLSTRKHLQLVGITSMLVAAKFEEVHPIEIEDCVHVTDSAYTNDEVKVMEVLILTALEFKICCSTPLHFLEHYQSINNCSDVDRHFGQYLLELALIDCKMSCCAPSHLAAAAFLLSNKLMRRRPSWSPALVEHTKMTAEMLQDVAGDICSLLQQAEDSKLQAVRKKFSSPKHYAVAKIDLSNSPTSRAARVGGA